MKEHDKKPLTGRDGRVALLAEALAVAMMHTTDPTAGIDKLRFVSVVVDLASMIVAATPGANDNEPWLSHSEEAQRHRESVEKALGGLGGCVGHSIIRDIKDPDEPKEGN